MVANTPETAQDALESFLRSEGAITAESHRDNRRGRTLAAIALTVVSAGLSFAQNAQASPGNGSDAADSPSIDAGDPIKGIDAPQIGDGQAAHQPHTQNINNANGDEFTSQDYTAFVDQLQSEFDNSDLSGKVFMLDASAEDVYASTMKEVRQKVGNDTITGDRANTILNALQVGQAKHDGAFASWGRINDKGEESFLEVGDANYNCIAVGNDLEAPGLAADRDGNIFSNGVSQEEAHKWSIVHEAAHCAQSVKADFLGFANEQARTMMDERVADSTAALWLLQNGESMDMVENILSTRWHDRTTEYGPEKAEHALQHHTEPALERIRDNVDQIRSADWFGNASIVEIAQGPAKDIALESLRDQGMNPDGSGNQGWKDLVSDYKEFLKAKENGNVAELSGRPAEFAAKGERAIAALEGVDTPPDAGASDSLDARKNPAKQAIVPRTPSDAALSTQKLSPAGEKAAAAFEERVTRHHRNERISGAVASFADWAMAQGLSLQDAKEIALQDSTVQSGMRGFSFFGIDSPARRDAKAGFGYAFDRAWEQMESYHPGPPPETPENYSVKRIGDKWVTKNPDGKVDNPMGPAVQAASREEYILDGERLPRSDWMQRPKVQAHLEEPDEAKLSMKA